jgi:hypothetical protein
LPSLLQATSCTVKIISHTKPIKKKLLFSNFDHKKVASPFIQDALFGIYATVLYLGNFLTVCGILDGNKYCTSAQVSGKEAEQIQPLIILSLQIIYCTNRTVNNIVIITTNSPTQSKKLCHEISDHWFFHQTTLHGLLNHGLEPFRIKIRIRRYFRR